MFVRMTVTNVDKDPPIELVKEDTDTKLPTVTTTGVDRIPAGTALPEETVD